MGLASTLRAWFWHRGFLLAVLAVLGAKETGALLLDRALGRDLAQARQTAEGLRRDIALADLYIDSFSDLETLRASFLLTLVAVEGDPGLHQKLDQLYRLRAKSAFNRILATIHPQDWRDRLDAYDALMARETAYGEAVAEMQAIETAALKALVARQTVSEGQLVTLGARIDRLTAQRDGLARIGQALSFLLVILAFFLQNARPEPQGA